MEEYDVKYAVESMVYLGASLGLIFGIASAVTGEGDFYQRAMHVVNSTIYGTGFGLILGNGLKVFYDRFKK
ncbi:MAG: hypothetical protein QXF88_01170 [Candidatus Aenigmatarchaeota archaeon]